MSETERVSLLAAAFESPYGVDALPEAIDFTTAVYEPRSIEHDNEFEFLDKMRVRPTRASKGKNLGPTYRKLTIKFDAAGPDDPGASPLPTPRLGDFLLASEMVASSSGGPPTNTNTYNFRTRETQQSLTVKLWEFFLGEKRAKQVTCLGCRFAWTFEIGVGEPGVFTFEGCGLVPAGGDTERLFTSAELYTDIPAGRTDLVELCDAANGRAMTLTYGAWVVRAKSIKIATNRKVALVKDVNGANAYTACYVTADEGATFMVEVDPLEEANATVDVWPKIITESLEALTIVVDTAGGTRMTFNFPQAQLGPFSRDIDDNLVRLGFEVYPQDGADGDDACNMAWTRTP